MVWILGLLQVKTVRSAWALLIGSGLMLAWGAYGAYQMRLDPGPGAEAFDAVLLPVWFAVTGGYMVIAAWALFSGRGRSYLEAQQQAPVKGNRSTLWYVKFLFACFAAAFATMIVLGLLAWPFAGPAGLDWLTGPDSNGYLLLIAALWSPLIFSHLK